MKDKSTTLYTILRPFLKALFWFLYHPKIINRENIPTEGAAILAGNHKNNMDPVVLCYSTKRQVHLLAKKELFKGWKKKFFSGMGCIPVDRSKKDEHVKEETIEELKKGKLIGIFPEGTHNKTKELLMPFKFGAVSFAKKTNTKLIPFAIKGKYRLFRRGLIIEIGEPLDISNMELDEANALLREKVGELLLK